MPVIDQQPNPSPPNISRVHLRWWVWVASLVLSGTVLAACGLLTGNAPGSTSTDGAIVQPDEPCVIDEVTINPGAVMPETRLMPDPNQSPAYCDETLVITHFLEAIESALWYAPPDDASCTALTPPTAYPDTLSADLARYYTGDLLHAARETLYYNQQAQPPRMVLACWDVRDFRERVADGREPRLEWLLNERGVVVRLLLQDYRLLVYEVQNGSAELASETVDDTISDQRIWQMTMVYDAHPEVERWKVLEAENCIPDPSDPQGVQC